MSRLFSVFWLLPACRKRHTFMPCNDIKMSVH
jgi:hypothetical protein